MTHVTCILDAIEQGDLQAADKLLPLVYDVLRLLASQKMSQEKSGQMLQATALVHEAYYRLVGVKLNSGIVVGIFLPRRQKGCRMEQPNGASPER
jgi:hypothetical protein